MRVIILTRSDKHYNDVEGGYCVAGLNYDDRGQWIRLLGRHDHMKITNEEAVYQDGTICEPLDIIEVDNPILVDAAFYNANSGNYDDLADYRIQPENYLVPISRFRKIGEVSIDELFTDAPIGTDRYIFGNTDSSLSVPEAISNNKSLTIIKAEDLWLEPRENYNRAGFQAHYRATFRYNGIEYSNISVTDPEYAAELTNFDSLSFGDTYLIISLGELYKGKHYKLIAKIFETVYTINNNRLKYFHAFADCRYLERYRNNLQRALWKDMVAEGMKACPACMERLSNLQ